MELNSITESKFSTSKPKSGATDKRYIFKSKPDTFEKSNKRDISFTGKTPWGFVQTLNIPVTSKITGAVKTYFYNAANQLTRRRVYLDSDTPQKISFKNLCKILSSNGEEFYIDEEGLLKLSDSIQARKSTEIAKYNRYCSNIEFAINRLQDLFKQYGEDTPITKDYEKIIPQIKYLRKKAALNENDSIIFENILRGLQEAIQGAQKANTALMDLEIRPILKPLSTLQEAKDSLFTISNFMVDRKNKICKLYTSALNGRLEAETILTYEDIEKYLDLIKSYDFISPLNIRVTEKDGQKFLKFDNFNDSPYSAIHVMHRLIQRYGKKEDGSIDFNEIKKILDSIQENINSQSIPTSHHPQINDSFGTAGLYLPWGKTSLGNTSLIIPYKGKYDFINAVFNKDGKLVTIKGSSEKDVDRNFIPFKYFKEAN